MNKNSLKYRFKNQLSIWTGINVGAILCRIPTFSRIRQLKKDLKKFKSQRQKEDEFFPITKLYPCFFDKKASSGNAYDGYFWQDLYVAQRIYENKPVRHLDIGSRVDGFVAHIASFREIEVIDVRPLESNVPNITFTQMDLIDSDKVKDEYVDSISCLHALEHFGLGRYGDSICYNGYLIGFENITRTLKSNGRLYLSVPIGIQRIEFHAHRVFSLSYLLKMCSKYYEIERFSYFDDEGNFCPNVKLTNDIIENNCGCKIMGLAIFELIKKL